ncbi:arsenate reductase ArsC [Parahaliea mediterranea]|uniref:Arsenate reductase ArsC n=1 Tax=Parahaliea mediterranea TaxID=651086 RepID=A0A939DJK5_9GAMM|nr:arsenate reductase ArsC [Parahaliea mediterranea]MBN7798986.1 arsenate reductase ArsC [Parahaliea mediterranea]
MKILFVCTHNRCRSILCEAIANHFSAGILDARSAGSQPAGAVHPLTLSHLQQAGIAVDGLASQSWDELAAFEAEVVITVCNNAAGEACPAWLGPALKSHWDLADPTALDASREDIDEAFRTTIELITARIHELKRIATLPRDHWPEALNTLED